MHTIVCTNDSCDVSPMKASRCIVVRAIIVFGEIPPTDDSVACTIPTPQRHMIKCNATIDDRNGLSFTIQSELRVNPIPARLLVSVGKMGIDVREGYGIVIPRRWQIGCFDRRRGL